MIHALARGDPDRRRAWPTIPPRAADDLETFELKVLEQAGLVERPIEGRVHRFRLPQKPPRRVERWTARQQEFWTGAVDRLDRLLQEISRNGS